MPILGAGDLIIAKVLAGRPKDQEAVLKAAGVDQFVFAGGDAIAMLTGLHKTLGV